MKKAIVIGGSNGIGLAISKNLIERGYFVYIFDICAPDFENDIDSSKIEYNKCNLLDFNLKDFDIVKNDSNVSLLMITAGIGRCTHFENLNIGEIKNVMTINATSTIQIIRYFYDRLNSRNDFYCGIMGSIAGLVNSPLFSVYGASKAAICSFIDSINIELEKKSIKNRILNVSPGSLKGTKFNGSTSNDISLISNIANEIVNKLFSRKTLYIPDYENTYKSVLERNNNNKQEFGLNSYDYKISSGRFNDEYKGCIGYLSGTFDLFHVGHLNLLRRAKEQCDYLIVGVHPDASHKGKETFIPFEERKEIVASIKYVDEVVQSFPEDSDAWAVFHYNKLFVGSDYKGTERFMKYEEYFSDKNVKIVYFPYTKGTSSTQIRDAVIAKSKV